MLGDDGLRCMSSLVPAPAPWLYSPEKLVCGREGIGEVIAAGHWMCQGGSQSCPLRQRMWPGLRRGGSHEAHSTGTTRATGPTF